MSAGGPPQSVRLSGVGLHSGLSAAVRFVESDGPVVFRTARGEARVDELAIVRADHGVRIRRESIELDVDTVEHLLAAFGGLGVRTGVAIEVGGVELPLLDGAALAFAEAIGRLRAPASAPSLRIAREDVVQVGASTYAFTPADGVALDVDVDFEAKKIGKQAASWDGGAESFLRDVAWARTFGFRRDAEALLRAGRARAVDARAVMVLGDDGGVEAPGAPARPEEFARHKLLDLVGDLYFWGGPPRGRIRATRPGHAATHRAMAEALSRGIVER